MERSTRNFWLVAITMSAFAATLIEIANGTFGIVTVFSTAVSLVLLVGSGLIVYQLITE